MTCGRRWIEEPRLFDRKSDDFPSQSLLTSGLDGRPSSSLHCLPRVHHPHAADANAPVCAAGATTPEPDPGVEGREEGLDLPGGQIGVRLLCGEVGVCWGREEWSGSARRADRREIVVCGRGECVGGRGEGLDSPRGRIGVSLLTGAKFGDRMKKNIFGAINEQISNFAQTYPTNLKASSNEALLFMRRYRFANCSCFSCCFKDAYPSSNVQ